MRPICHVRVLVQHVVQLKLEQTEIFSLQDVVGMKLECTEIFFFYIGCGMIET